MNYYQPRQLDPECDNPNAGKWHYTCFNRRLGTFPVGYCAQGCAGHDDAEGAYKHQTEYLLAERLKLDGQFVNHQEHCQFEGCDTWTDRFAEVDNGWAKALCDEHRTKEVVTVLFGTVGDVIASW